MGLFTPTLPAGYKSWEELRQKNNPENKPTGHFTGRCKHCHSNKLWDDNLAYGCDCCGALLNTN